jgi:hypothetical protein
LDSAFGPGAADETDRLTATRTYTRGTPSESVYAETTSGSLSRIHRSLNQADTLAWTRSESVNQGTFRFRTAAGLVDRLRMGPVLSLEGCLVAGADTSGPWSSPRTVISTAGDTAHIAIRILDSKSWWQWDYAFGRDEGLIRMEYAFGQPYGLGNGVFRLTRIPD